MVEVYVYSEGGKPVEVILGRRHAVNRLMANNFKLTDAEKKQMAVFLEGAMCDLGSGLHVVGIVRDVGQEALPDRRITRVIGPGSTV